MLISCIECNFFLLWFTVSKIKRSASSSCVAAWFKAKSIDNAFALSFVFYLTKTTTNSNKRWIDTNKLQHFYIWYQRNKSIQCWSVGAVDCLLTMMACCLKMQVVAGRVVSKRWWKCSMWVGRMYPTFFQTRHRCDVKEQSQKETKKCIIWWGLI